MLRIYKDGLEISVIEMLAKTYPQTYVEYSKWATNQKKRIVFKNNTVTLCEFLRYNNYAVDSDDASGIFAVLDLFEKNFKETFVL